MKSFDEKIGFTAGAFDLLHAGHVMMLEEAKTQCDWLICGLQVDPSLDRKMKNSPVQSIVERYAQLKAVKYVNEIIPYNTEEDLEDILTMYEINVRILGEEYIDEDFTGKNICNFRDIDIYFNKRDHRFSTSALRQQIITEPVLSDREIAIMIAEKIAEQTKQTIKFENND
jgi:glycerol-3-phosphate cytidylyltransferase